MSRKAALAQWDLVAVAAIALAGLLATAIPFPDWIRTVFLLPLALFLPGYAVAAALFPPGFVTRDERAVFVVAFGIVASALGGLLLQVFARLDRASWLVLLLVIALGACAVALWQRRELPGGPAPAPRWRLPRPDPVVAVAAIAAALVAAGALAIASGGAERKLDGTHFSALWLTPRESGPGTLRGALSVGVQNHEAGESGYRLQLAQDGTTIRQWRFRLPQGQIWQMPIPAAEIEGTGPVVALLFRHDRPYRRVAIEPERAF